MNLDLGILLMRLSFGLTMAFAHGWGKLNMLMEGGAQFPDPLGVGPVASLALATFAELLCSLLVAAGLFTRMALIPLIVTMAVAFFVIHGADPFGKQEKAFLFLCTFVALFISGPGKYSLQSMFSISSNSKVPFVAFLLK